MLNICKFAFIAQVFVFFICSQVYGGAKRNLIENSNFEKVGDGGRISGWKTFVQGNSSVEISSEAHAGERSVKIQNPSFLSNKRALNVGICTNEFRSPPFRATVKISGWLKAENVKKGEGSYHKLRLTIYAMDENKGMLAHQEIACVDGSFDWRQFSGEMIIPKGTDLLKIGCWLTNATGVVWVDDVTAVVTKLPPSAEDMLKGDFNIEAPVIMPEPWKVKREKKKFEFSNVEFSPDQWDDRLKSAVEARFNAPVKNGDAELVLSKKISDESKVIVQRDFPDIPLESLGDEGYFLLTSEKSGKLKIYLIANTDKGLFYAFQSLKQVLSKKNDAFVCPLIQIADKPTLSLRGAVIGLLLREHKEIEAIRRCADLKLNLAYIGGTTLNNKLGGNPKFGTNWRKPFSESELKILKNVIAECRNNFVTPAITFSPRGNPPNCYSSDDDINIIVEKMLLLYNMGVRAFGLNFDDMSNSGNEGLGDKRDRVKFKNAGEAHLYFASNIYERLKKKADGVFEFFFLPMAYGRFKNMSDKDRAYLRTVSALPEGISFISCANGEDAIEHGYSDIIGRKHIIWDNFFCGWGRIGGAPAFIPPFEGDTRLSDKNIAGYFFLPQMKRYEDSALISWMTAADYMWSPERYDYQNSFKRAVLKALGDKSNIPKLADYIGRIEKLASLALPQNDKTARLNYVKESIEYLKNSKTELKGILSKNLYDSEVHTIDNTLNRFKLIENDLKKRPFPLKIRPLNGKMKIDGKLDEDAWEKCAPLSDFINIKTLDPARFRTSAKILYDEQNLYLGVVCYENNVAGIVAKHKARDSQVFADDSIELFLDTARTMKKYYHIAVNSSGAVYDAIVQNKAWNGKYEIGTNTGEDSWTLEMAIPFEQFGFDGIRPGMRWNFNLCREKNSQPKEFSSYALLILKGFHNPARFWTMEFEKGENR